NPASVPSVEPDLSQIIVDPPEKIIAPTRTDKPWLSRRGQKIDFAERDAANRKLAKLGEEFVFNLERHRLTAEGRDDLAARGDDPVTLLGLAALVETRGDGWQASDEEIDRFVAEFDYS